VFFTDEHNDGASSGAIVICTQIDDTREFEIQISFVNYVWSEVIPLMPVLGDETTAREPTEAHEKTMWASASYHLNGVSNGTWNCDIDNGGIFSWSVTAAVENHAPVNDHDISKWHSNGTFHAICSGWSMLTPVAPGTVTFEATF